MLLLAGQGLAYPTLNETLLMERSRNVRPRPCWATRLRSWWNVTQCRSFTRCRSKLSFVVMNVTESLEMALANSSFSLLIIRFFHAEREFTVVNEPDVVYITMSPVEVFSIHRQTDVATPSLCCGKVERGGNKKMALLRHRVRRATQDVSNKNFSLS